MNSLHGGLVGFGDHVWSQVRPDPHQQRSRRDAPAGSPNGDSSGAAGSPGCPAGCTGFPAELTVDVTYTLNNADQSRIHYKAHNDSSTLSTVVNLTNHSYFNLAGQGSPQAPPTASTCRSTRIGTRRPTPPRSRCRCRRRSVAGTPFDFRAPHTIGSRINDVSAPDNVPAATTR